MDGAPDCMQDGVTDGALDCTQDGVTDGALDAALDKVGNEEANVKIECDGWSEDFVNMNRSSFVWFCVARMCWVRHCDRADFAPTSGPNEGAFLLPGPQGKFFQYTIPDMQLITFLPHCQLPPLCVWEPVQICLILKIDDHLNHHTVHLECRTIHQ